MRRVSKNRLTNQRLSFAKLVSFRDSNGMLSQTSWYIQKALALTLSQVQGLLCQVLPARAVDGRGSAGPRGLLAAAESRRCSLAS
jgi:hypothetical protein